MELSWLSPLKYYSGAGDDIEIVPESRARDRLHVTETLINAGMTADVVHYHINPFLFPDVKV